MKKRVPYLILAISAIFIFNSCQKNGLTYNERRVVGNWEYKKVKFIERWSVKTNDLTEDFDQFDLQFNADFSATLTNIETGEISTGLWELSENGNAEGSINNLFVSLKSEESGELSQLVFENLSITNRKLYATYRNPEGNFRYVLQED